MAMLFPAGALASERQLVSTAAALGAAGVPTLSKREQRALRGAFPVAANQVEELRSAIRAGADPLGEAFCRLRSAEERRASGATYTPNEIVNSMVSWSASLGREPARIVDPGVGSGRFLTTAGLKFKTARLVGFEIDPVASLLARANLSVLGLGKRASVLLCDYRAARIEAIRGETLFIGNPPYVRHHLIAPRWKEWLSRSAAQLGCSVSQLAGLHAYFFLATAMQGRENDFGVFVTSAEWLDVNYGRLIRELFLGKLGGSSLCLLEPTARAFPDAATTAVITSFELGTKSRSVKVKRVSSLEEIGGLGGGDLCTATDSAQSRVGVSLRGKVFRCRRASLNSESFAACIVAK